MVNPAFDILERRLREHPNSPLFARIAELYLGENRLEDALALCDQGLAMYPFYPTAHLVRARILQTLNRLDEAMAELAIVRQLVPDATTIDSEFLMLKRRDADISATSPSHDRPSSVDQSQSTSFGESSPSDAERYLASPTLAEIYVQQRKLHEAIRIYEYLLATKPEHRHDIMTRLAVLKAQALSKNDESLPKADFHSA